MYRIRYRGTNHLPVIAIWICGTHFGLYCTTALSTIFSQNLEASLEQAGASFFDTSCAFDLNPEMPLCKGISGVFVIDHFVLLAKTSPVTGMKNCARISLCATGDFMYSSNAVSSLLSGLR